MTVRSWVLVAWILLAVQASGCTGVKSEPPRAGDASPREQQPIPPTGPAERPKPKSAEATQPKPAEPPSRSAEQPQPRPPAAPAPKPAAPAPPRPAAPPAQKPAAPAPPAQSAAPSPQQAAIGDLTSLEERLRDTSAIGVFTKLSLKNEVDDLLDRFRAFHDGHGGATLAKLRESFDLLVMKVVSLLQDKDAPLARDVFSSREALWNLLADPVKFKTLGSDSTRGFAWRTE
jgi:hypothetical protein